MSQAAVETVPSNEFERALQTIQNLCEEWSGLKDRGAEVRQRLLESDEKVAQLKRELDDATRQQLECRRLVSDQERQEAAARRRFAESLISIKVDPALVAEASPKPSSPYGAAATTRFEGPKENVEDLKNRLTFGKSEEPKVELVAGRATENAPPKPQESLEGVVQRLDAKSATLRALAEGNRQPLESMLDSVNPALARWARIAADIPAGDRRGLEELAGCCEATAEAARMLLPYLDQPALLPPGREAGGTAATEEDGREILQAAAASQSSLRHAVQSWMAALVEDPDQQTVFLAIRNLGFQRRIFVERHLSAYDLAPTSDWRKFRDHVVRLRDRVSRTKEMKKDFSSIKYETDRLRQNDPAPAERWKTIDRRVEHLLEKIRLQPSSAELRSLIVPVLNTKPEEFEGSPSFQAVMQHIYEYVAEQSEREEEELTGKREPTHVLEARKLLEGKRMLVIGGIPKPHAIESYVRRLGLDDVEWPEVGEHKSTAPFENMVSRCDVVLALIQWCGHAYSWDLKEMAERHGRAYVRIPGGYNVSQVAHEVLDQVSDQFKPAAV